MTKHVWLDPWKGTSGLCPSSKRVEMSQEMPEARFLGPLFLAGDGPLCGHCRRALAYLRDDLHTILERDA